MKNRTSLLILEDNPQLISFYRNTFSVSLDWELVFCQSFENGIELLKKKKFDYVLSEAVLEKSASTGIDFLKKVSDLQPESVRLYISGKSPLSDDYYYFHAFIPKSELNCNTLQEVMNSMVEDTAELM